MVEPMSDLQHIQSPLTSSIEVEFRHPWDGWADLIQEAADLVYAWISDNAALHEVQLTFATESIHGGLDIHAAGLAQRVAQVVAEIVDEIHVKSLEVCMTCSTLAEQVDIIGFPQVMCRYCMD